MEKPNEIAIVNLMLIAKENPNVDMIQIEETLRVLKELDKEGIKPTKYSLSSPFSRTTFNFTPRLSS
jgi:hypothetical protein